MQEVLPQPNPDFVVPPLQSLAPTIIARMKTVVPVDTAGPYGSNSQRNSYNTNWKFTWGTNDQGFSCQNLHLVFDITPTWYNTDVVNVLQHLYPLLVPSFDMSTSALISKLTIRTPSGAVIEDFQAYNEFSAIIRKYLTSANKKEHDLYALSSFSKDIEFDKGLSPLLDGIWDRTLNPNAIAHGQTRRIIMSFNHSAWFNKERFIPLFLLRNGLQIEGEFEDPYRAFVFQQSRRLDTLPRLPFLSRRWIGGTGTLGESWPNFYIVPGTIYLGGGDVAAAAAPAAGAVSALAAWGIPPFFAAPGSDAGAAPYSTKLSYFKNGLLLRASEFEAVYARLRPFNITAAFSGESDASILASNRPGFVFAYPVNIYRHGKLGWHGFTAFRQGVYTVNEHKVEDVVVQSPNYITFVDPEHADGAMFQYLNAAPTVTRTGGVTAAAHAYVFLPLYNYDHFTPTAGSVGSSTIPFACFNGNQVDVYNYFQAMQNMELELVIDWDHGFEFSVNGRAAPDGGYLTGSPTYDADPRQAVMSYWAQTNTNPFRWDYTVTNLSLLVDWIKPAADIQSNYIRTFQDNTGIPYVVPRVMRNYFTLPGGQMGFVSKVITFSVRSLTTLLVVLKDPYFNTYGDSDTIQYLPALSSFQRRGLSRVEVSIGGSRKPEYTIQMDRHGGIEHIPEAANALGMASTSGFDPSFHRLGLAPIRNYVLAGNFDTTAASLVQMWEQRQEPSSSYLGYSTRCFGLEYTDSDSFIIAIDLTKSNSNPFAAGLDTSMSGQLTLNLWFNQDADPTPQGTSFDPGAGLRRGCNVIVYGLASGVLTLQNNAVTYRM